MSLLHSDTPEANDDAARGEEFTKGTTHLILAAVVAALAISVVIALYFIAGHKPPVASGEILSLVAHPQHIQTPGIDANGAPRPVETYDQVLVFARLRLTNRSRQPLTLLNVYTNATMSDGIHSSSIATLQDYDRIFQLYAPLPFSHDPGLAIEQLIEPGQSIEGSVVSIFKMTRAEWDARKNLDLTVRFRYQPDLHLRPAAPPIER